MRYFEDRSPGEGMPDARAQLRTDAPRLSLNGAWAVRRSSRADGPADFVDRGFDDSGWDRVAVPSEGTDAHAGTSYPFPIDPPFVPDENPTGDYRCRFALPAGWPGGAAVLRFEDVGSCARVWVNGECVGTTRASGLPAEFEVGELLRMGDSNVLAVRVHQWSSGSYLETAWRSGIFGDVTVLARPASAIEDVFVHADYDHVTGAGRLRIDAGPGVRVTVPELGIEAASGETVEVGRVEAWSAEIPRL